MALRACRDCGAEISTGALHCPHCGRATGKGVRDVTMAFGIGCWLPLLVLFALVVALIWTTSG
jgi:hypothetical protein